MSTPTSATIRRVSRRDLAVFRPVWLAVGGMYALFAIGATVMVLVVTGIPIHRYQLLAAWAIVVSVILLRSEPPAIGTLQNHAVVACTYCSVALTLWAAQPGGGLAVGGAIFIGPLTAVRLESRRQIGLHLTAAVTLLTLVAGIGFALGQVDATTLLATMVFVFAAPVLGLCTAAILEASELQGDELERLVRRDPLTGVGNRRMLDERLADQIRLHSRTDRELSILALDLNGFKGLNDTLGHAAGDELLMEVAAALVRLAPSREAVIRQGGDEFCLILPETGADGARRIANEVHAAFAGIDVQGMRLTSGVGIATFPTDALDGFVLLHVADDRLRASKAPRKESATPAQTTRGLRQA